MKRWGNLIDKIADPDNIRLAIRKASRHKKNRPNVQRVLKNPEYYVYKLRNLILTGNCYTSEYKIKFIPTPKPRNIFILPFFPDRILQHAVINVLEPYWEKLFIYDSYACRAGKGQHRGSKRLMQFIRSNSCKNNYVLKCDISKFYPSINHEILKTIIRKKIKDKKVLDIIDRIITSQDTCISSGKVKQGIGVPIGNLISQWFGNIYLHELDVYIKHELKIKKYVRYCDDFVLVHHDKEYLNKVAKKLNEFIKTKLKLRLSKCALFPIKHGIDFLGYRHFNKYILVRKKTAQRIKQRARTILAKPNKNFEINKGRVASMCGWLFWANSHNLSLSIKLTQLVDYFWPKNKKLKLKIRNEYKHYIQSFRRKIKYKRHRRKVNNC